jgi:hypothetical protein
MVLCSLIKIFSDSFKIDFKVRQGSVFFLFLFAVHLDDIAIGAINMALLWPCYPNADDILLLSPSLCDLQITFRACESELIALDMTINTQNSVV